MEKMSLWILTIIYVMMLNPSTSHAQSILERAKQKIKQRADAKVDKALDKSLDKVEKDTKIKNADSTNEGTSTPALAYNSKYDFVPGEKTMAFEDFSKTEIGDFPTRWNTNSTAEVVTLNSKEGKWLKISKEGVFHPEFITNLPDNFTLEFDLGVNNEFNASPFVLNIANLKKPEDFNYYYYQVDWKGDYAIHLQFRPLIQSGAQGMSSIIAGKNGNHVLNNDVAFKVWDNTKNTFAHIALWRQNHRLRVYMNGEKVWDIPRAFDSESKFNAITMAMRGSYNQDNYYLVNNIRLAVGAPDTRNKLVTEGKFVTRGILFDVNSDRIKPESSGSLKDIANVLKENTDIKVKIVGHTDADGDDKANLALSEKRAAAVKSILVKEYGVSGNNLITEGKGESDPADKNVTAEGKANNRRVEFIKM